jgi:predicted glycosyltransferase
VATKLLFYAHNGGGLGHLSRLTKIGRYLQSEIGNLAILYLTQCAAVTSFPLPAGSDIVRLPTLSYTPALVVPKTLALPFDEILAVRREVMRAASVAYGPDFFLVDHSPVGVRGDLIPAIRALRELPNPPRIVCGLLDMLEPEYTRRRWDDLGIIQALDELYDEVWVYGSREIFDVAEQYAMPEAVARKVRYLGYVGVSPPAVSPRVVRDELGVGSGKLVVVSVGGAGLQHTELLTAYLDALDSMPSEIAIHSVLITGSQAPADIVGAIRERSDRMAGQHPALRRFHVVDFTPRFEEYLVAADAVVVRGGYNTVVEAISFGVRPIVVPANQANSEQRIRGEIFARKGVLRVPDPALPLPEALVAELSEAFAKPAGAIVEPRVAGLDLDGLSRFRDHFVRLMTDRRRAAHSAD